MIATRPPLAAADLEEDEAPPSPPPSPPPATGLLSPALLGGTAAAPIPGLPVVDTTQLPGGTLALTALGTGATLHRPDSSQKVCCVCNNDCSTGERGRSSTWGYFHLACKRRVRPAPPPEGDDGEEAAHKRPRIASPPPPPPLVCWVCGNACLESQHRQEVPDGGFMHVACLPPPTQPSMPPPPPRPSRRSAEATAPQLASQRVEPGTRLVVRWKALPPSKARVLATLSPQVLNHGATFSRPQDRPTEQAAYLPWEVVVPPGPLADRLRRFAPPAPPPPMRDSPGLVMQLGGARLFSQGPRLYVASLDMWARRAQTVAGASWQQPPSGRNRSRGRGANHRPLFALTPAKPPPRRSAVVAWLDARRAGCAPAPCGATPSARAVAPAPEHGAESSSDEEDALVLSLSDGVGAVNPGRGGGPAQVGLLVGANAWPPDEPQPRPPSPKYETDVTFWDVIQATSGGPAAMGEATATAAAADGARQEQTETPATQPIAGGGAPAPPGGITVEAASRRRRSSTAAGAPSQITGPTATHTSTPASQAGFRPGSGGVPGGEANHVSVMTIEMCAQTRGALLPDPAHDAVLCIAVCLLDDSAPPGATLQQVVLLVDPPSEEPQAPIRVPGTAAQFCVPHEAALFEAFITLVKAMDPDIMLGYDVHSGSLGYLADRHAVLQMGRDRRTVVPLLRAVSRTPAHSPPGAQFQDTYGLEHMAGMWVTGRVVFNLWRILRAEVKLQSYTFQSAAAAVLKRRVPCMPASQLHCWHSRRPDRWRAAAWVLGQADGCVRLCQQLDLVARTAELARVFGIQLEDVVVRGSQHRVESMMLRLAHNQNYVAISPTKDDLRRIPAPAHIALVMEPVSGFYTSPVVVLDFQSLYPSQIIAYNLCYSTCLGTLPGCTPAELLDTPRSFGVTALTMPKGLLGAQGGVEGLYIAPNGAVFVPPATRVGVLPRLLTEILDTRVMVKAALKAAPRDARVLQRCLQARQLGLKLIANVTYGYTAANFSGRMPLPELADAIVSSGRATLERAIEMVNSNAEWDAKVVYGDTDSLFVHLPGRTKEQAFAIGAAIAAAVTAANPAPVKLQLEKVYLPCLLVAKKRYVGMAWDSPGAAAPSFDDKGIETVRRDTCGAVSKTVERSLRLLFATRDLSRVKAYLLRQWARIYGGRLSVADATHAKEVRSFYVPGKVVPSSALVGRRATAADPRAKPHAGQRVPYVVVDGLAGSRVTDMVHSPADFLAAGGALRLNADYYITRQVAALHRLLSLAGGNVKAWVAEAPLHVRRSATKEEVAHNAGRSIITNYYRSDHCAVCGQFTGANGVVCATCSAAPQETAAVLGGRVRSLSATVGQLHAVCTHCGGGDGGAGISCVSLDCPVFYERDKRGLELSAAQRLLREAADLLDRTVTPDDDMAPW
jgi:DNA polymerase zeta